MGVSRRIRGIDLSSGSASVEIRVVAGGGIRGRAAGKVVLADSGGARMVLPDANGEFEFERLRPGRYQLSFASRTVNVDVPAGKEVEVDAR